MYYSIWPLAKLTKKINYHLRHMTTQTNAKKILLIDDDPLIVRMYERKLVQEGFEMLLASNGEEGLRVLENETPNLILLDVLMPKVDGWVTLKKIKENPRTQDIPVIVLTTVDDRDENVQKFKEYGVKEYLVKSKTDLKALVESVRRHMA